MSTSRKIGPRPEIVVTKEDFELLAALFARLPPSAEHAMERLDAELDRATLVEASLVPDDVVTIGRTVRYEETSTGDTRTATVVCPGDADPDRGLVSVLSPVGAALLGLRVGQTIDWSEKGKRPRSYRVLDVVHPPRAA